LPEVARVIHDREPSRLGSINTLYRGDIETIVAKSLEKDKARRYASAGELAADIRRQLKGEPIVARPTGFMERGWKWTRRNPALASLLAAVAVLLVSGTVVSSALALWAMRGWDQADQNAHELGRALDRETAERQRAEDKEKTAHAREAETRAVLNFVEEKVFAAARPKGEHGGLGRNVELRQAVEAALPFVNESFKEQPLIEARLRLTLGASFWYLGDPKLAAEQFESTSVPNTPTRSRASTGCPAATTPSAGATRPFGSMKKRWRCGRRRLAPTTPRRFKAWRPWPSATPPSADTTRH
jgi:hypothetical protein